MIILVSLVLGIAVGAAIPSPGYCGRHRMSWAAQWDAIHPRLPWQVVRRRIAASRRARRRPRAHTLASVRPGRRVDEAWAWWLTRRSDYAPALKAAGAW